MRKKIIITVIVIAIIILGILLNNKNIFSNAEESKSVQEETSITQQNLTIDYCEPHTCDFNHELGEQNSQRI